MKAYNRCGVLLAMPCLLQDQYIEVNSPIPSSATLFGNGEHISATGLPLRRDGTPLTLWTRDCAAADPDQNTYGSWPFMIDVRKGTSSAN